MIRIFPPQSITRRADPRDDGMPFAPAGRGPVRHRAHEAALTTPRRAFLWYGARGTLARRVIPSSRPRTVAGHEEKR